MVQEKRDYCSVEVGRDVKITCHRVGPPAFHHAADTSFDLQAAQKLNSQPGKTSIQEYGRKLFDLVVLADEKQKVSHAYQSSFHDPGSCVEVRIKILRGSAPQLVELSWEHLCDPDGKYPSLDDRVRFARMLSDVEANAQPISEPPKVLAVISDPEYGLPRLGLARIEVPFDAAQTQYLTHWLDGLLKRKRITDYRILRGPFAEGVPHDVRQHSKCLTDWPTPERIRKELEAARKPGSKPYEIVHFLAHGYKDEKGAVHLVLPSDEGTATFVGRTPLQTMFPGQDRHDCVRLVFLAACHGASGEQEAGKPLAGLAPALLDAGVPAVVAMQDEIDKGAAATFTEAFYEELGDSGYIDKAVAVARAELRLSVAIGRDGRCQGDQWFIPVLYLQNQNPRLFDPTVTASVRKLTEILFKAVKPKYFFNREDELRHYVNLLYDRPRPKICWLSGEQRVGKRTLLEQLRYEGYQRGYGHLMVCEMAGQTRTETASKILYGRLYRMLRDILSKDTGVPQQCWATFLQGDTSTRGPVEIACRFIDGLEEFAEKLERGIVCLFYFWNFEANRNFLMGAFSDLINEVSDRYGRNELQRVRFMIATETPAGTDEVKLFPAIEGRLDKRVLGRFTGVESVKGLCQCHGIALDGQVPQEVWDAIRTQRLWGTNRQYLPGPPADVLVPLANRVEEGTPLTELDVKWLSVDEVGGGE